jgi:hypothetical protein
MKVMSIAMSSFFLLSTLALAQGGIEVQKPDFSRDFFELIDRLQEIEDDKKLNGFSPTRFPVAFKLRREGALRRTERSAGSLPYWR